jgi:hypothetical protein
MGNVTQDLRFGYEAALEAARRLWQLADELEGASGSVTSAHTAAVVDFAGPMRVDFQQQNQTNWSRLRELSGMARSLAEQIGRDWASARGQQDRINYQRYVEHEKAQDSMLDDFKQWFTGEPDYGSAPDNPPPATGPGFFATRCPQYSQFGP